MRIKLESFKGPLSLSNTLESEQCPADLWRFKNPPETYLKIDNEWVKIKVSQSQAGAPLEVKTLPRVKQSWRNELKKKILYLFWAEYPLNRFYMEFSSDSYLSTIIEKLQGLRVMRSQNLSWSLMEAVYSQNTTVEQVRRRDRLFRKHYGNKIDFKEGDRFYTFPKLSKIASLTKKELKQQCKVGYRAEYILNAAKTFNETKLRRLKAIGAKKARKRLMKVKGIGPKVADIFLLYGLGMHNTFPVDVNIKKALEREYFNNEETPIRRLRAFGLNKFGEHAGFAHLYLFNWERNQRKS